MDQLEELSWKKFTYLPTLSTPRNISQACLEGSRLYAKALAHGEKWAKISKNFIIRLKINIT